MGGGILLASMVAASASAAPSAGCPGSYTGLQLTSYVGDDAGNPVLVAHGVFPDQAVLDAFAREYANCAHRNAVGQMVVEAPDIEDFVLFSLPNRLYGIVAGTEAPPAGTESLLDVSTAEGFGRILWLAHLSGYYSGVWLRKQNGMPLKLNAGNDDIDSVYTIGVDEGREAGLTGSDEEVLAFNRSALRPQPERLRIGKINFVVIGAVAEPAGDDAGQFSYNARFLELILPPSRNAPSEAKPFVEPYFSADHSRLFDAHYALPEEAFLVDARQAYGRAEAANGDTLARLEEAIVGQPWEMTLLKQQDRYYKRANVLYSVGIPHFTRYGPYFNDQKEYDRLLAWNSYVVMANQSNAYNALAAYATQDAERGRRQALANAVMGAYVYIYSLGLTDPRYDGSTLEQALPSFVTATTPATAASRP